MATYKTPGVYIEEISIFPPSVAEVETAIPAFIGYTEIAEKKGEDLTNNPTKVSSLLEYAESFGGGFEVTAVDVTVDPANNYAVQAIGVTTRFYMYDALRLFFDNGGGDCYIISVGNYSSTIQMGDEADPSASPGFRVGLDALKKVDEPTIILFPDAVLMSESDLSTLQQKALSQCATLQDRVGVFDLKENIDDWEASVDGFRNGIGINNLKYGAAYTPWLYNAYTLDVDFSLIRDSVYDQADAPIVVGTDPPIDLATLSTDSDLNALVTTAGNAIADQSAVEALSTTLRGTAASVEDRYNNLKNAVAAATADVDIQGATQNLLAFVREVAVALAGLDGDVTSGGNLETDLDAYAASSLVGPVETLIALEKDLAGGDFSALADDTAVNADYIDFVSTGWLEDPAGGGDAVEDIAAGGADYTDGGGNTEAETAQAIIADLGNIFQNEDSSLVAFLDDVEEAAGVHATNAQAVLYESHSIISNIVELVKTELSLLPPSGAIAGVYAYMDNARGVFKAPANVSLSSVYGLTERIDDADQESLNVDTNSGKSINAIRAFAGKGILVWGARTLAGNDNEWRYVPVRRFFNMVEESLKKSTSFAVFEPNDASLWTKVKGMIDNYLIQKWEEGALAGAKPEEAFFVKVGLGETMTAQDILEGRLIVEIGMAVVRPAEFIILKFSHMLQQS